MSQGSILDPLVFLVYINFLHCAIKYSNVHHFSDETSLMNFQTSINKKIINKWIMTKIDFNVSKQNLFCLVQIEKNYIMLSKNLQCFSMLSKIRYYEEKNLNINLSCNFWIASILWIKGFDAKLMIR